MTAALYILAGIVALVLFIKWGMQPVGPSILSGPSPRYGFATAGPKKEDSSLSRPDRGGGK